MKPARNYWPIGVTLFFVLFFCAMAFVVVIAATHRDSLVSSNYYEQEMKFQEQIDSAARATAAGAGLHYDARAGQVVLTVPVAQLAQQLAGSVTLYRAAEPRLDRVFPLAPQPDGTQAFPVSQLAAGPWRMRAAWTAGGLAYFLEGKFVLVAK